MSEVFKRIFFKFFFQFKLPFLFLECQNEVKQNRVIMLIVLWIALVFISLTVLMQISKKVKYYVKYVGFHLYCILLTCICGIFCLLHKPGSSQNLVIAKYFLDLLKFEWIFGFRLDIERQDVLMKTKKPFVVVSNHQSALDAYIVVKCSPNGTAPLAKKILLYVPIFGFVCWLCGTVFINRKKGQKAIAVMKDVGRQMKDKLTSLWIFPEGTRHQLDKIMPFKKGAFHLAVQAQVPLIPVVIGNCRDVIDCDNELFEGGVIRVKCLQPIDTSSLTVDDVNDLCEKTFREMSLVFNEDLNENMHLFSKRK